MREAINDLHNIAQLGYEKNKDREVSAQSLEEVIEYVCMAAILCYNDFTCPNDDAVPHLHQLVRYYININADPASVY